MNKLNKIVLGSKYKINSIHNENIINKNINKNLK